MSNEVIRYNVGKVLRGLEREIESCGKLYRDYLANLEGGRSKEVILESYLDFSKKVTEFKSFAGFFRLEGKFFDDLISSAKNH